MKKFILNLVFANVGVLFIKLMYHFLNIGKISPGESLILVGVIMLININIDNDHK